MEVLENLLLTLVFLAVAIGSLGRISGWPEFEAFGKRMAAAIIVALICLPLICHEVNNARDGLTSHVSCALPRVVVVGPRHLAGFALIVAGHLAFGLWWLRRRARAEERRRLVQQREADRRRERGRLPPRNLDGGAS